MVGEVIGIEVGDQRGRLVAQAMGQQQQTTVPVYGPCQGELCALDFTGVEEDAGGRRSGHPPIGRGVTGKSGEQREQEQCPKKVA